MLFLSTFNCDFGALFQGWQYLGCYRDGGENSRAMHLVVPVDDKLTIEKCRSYCFNTTTFSYFGVEVSLAIYAFNVNCEMVSSILVANITFYKYMCI